MHRSPLPKRTPPSNLRRGDGGCCPATFFHAGDFSRSLLNDECFPINSKFIATAQNKRYSNYPLVVVYRTARHHLRLRNAPTPHHKTPDAS